MSTKRSMKKSGSRAKGSVSVKLVNKKLDEDAEVEGPTTKDCRFVGILNKKWKVFRVSPLYNYSKNKLKFYEKKLDEKMNSKEKVTSNVCYKSKFTLNKKLRFSDECPEALQVEIIKNDSKVIYVGHFLSWSNSKPDCVGSVCLPILLVEGKAQEVTAVHSSISKIFDCVIQPVTFSLYALTAFFVKLLEIPRNNIDVTQEQVTLEYKVPECEDNDKIKISFILESTIIVLAVVMDSLQEKHPGITSMEIILEFYNKILNHIYHIFQMDLKLAELQKISFPDAFLTIDGQLKMSNDDAAISVMDVLEHFTPLDGKPVM